MNIYLNLILAAICNRLRWLEHCRLVLCSHRIHLLAPGHKYIHARYLRTLHCDKIQIYESLLLRSIAQEVSSSNLLNLPWPIHKNKFIACCRQTVVLCEPAPICLYTPNNCLEGLIQLQQLTAGIATCTPDVVATAISPGQHGQLPTSMGAGNPKHLENHRIDMLLIP